MPKRSTSTSKPSKPVTVYVEDYVGKSGNPSVILSIEADALPKDDAHSLNLQAGFGSLSGYWIRWTAAAPSAKGTDALTVANRIAAFLAGVGYSAKVEDLR